MPSSEDKPTEDTAQPLVLENRDSLIREAYRRVFEQPPKADQRTATSSGAAALAEMVQVPFRGKLPSADDPNTPKPDSMAAPIDDLEQRLAAQLPASVQELYTLARRRAREVQNIILASGEIASERVFILDVAEAEDPIVHLNLTAE